MTKFTNEFVKKFWSCVARGPDCWEWMGYRSDWGYGHIRFKGRVLRSHRVAYELGWREDPKNLCVCHHCDNPSCCNPAHLFLGTQRDNTADRDFKGRSRGGSRPGEAHHNNKLTAPEVLRIREMIAAGGSRGYQREIARQFGVHFGTVNDLLLRKTWRHI